MSEFSQLAVISLIGYAVAAFVLGFQIRDLQGIVDEQDAYILLLEGRFINDCPRPIPLYE